MNCEHCGKELTKKWQKKFCSLRCQHDKRHIDADAKNSRKCFSCGNTFIMPQMSSRAMRGEDKAGLYCSRKCRWDYERLPEISLVYFNKCKRCGNVFTSKRKSSLCSHECHVVYERERSYQSNKSKKNIKVRKCKECSEVFVPEYGNKKRTFCSNICSDKYSNRMCKAIRRTRIHSNLYEIFNPYDVFNRDGWRCQLCNIKTPRRLRASIKDNAPELDHIVSLAEGGEHSMRNTQCLCRKCNQSKGATTKGQLRLFG